MWYQPTVTVPATEPISVADAKKHLFVLHGDDDDYIGDLIEAARDHAEKYCGARFAEQTVEVKSDDWKDLERMPVLPVASITSIGYVDTEGATQTVATSVYELRGDGIALKLNQVWPTKQEKSLITVTSVVGFETCPTSVRHAMLLWIGDAYEMRGSSEQKPFTTIDALLANSRYYQG
ncbi:hypothetical protein E2A64_10295 [Pseudohoeflea suaedae]|uniref:Phage gp6-like head-tail connector protein n=1 Tax=Pseudohoeflea suaedae TaxID=877384 RepID=A0A4R5PJ85_9HYPH|nr:head-tail connector protein [Pseudohoeflea suaedae]TDH35717.1 hypothetical protein E2A64_10295 [Pseudohoeflea suaedae]